MVKNQKGITLIALIITIIVMLILAGVAIAMATGDSGVIGKARSAQEKQIEAEIKTAAQMTYASLAAEYYSDTTTNRTVDKHFKEEVFKEEFGKNNPPENWKVDHYSCENGETITISAGAPGKRVSVTFDVKTVSGVPTIVEKVDTDNPNDTI